MNEVENTIEQLSEIEQDQTVPKNVRMKVKGIIDSLKNGGKETSIKVNEALQGLAEVSEDPNVPIYTRTQIWNIISAMESIG